MRGCHHHGTRQCQALYDGEVNVACPRRQINEEVIQFAPGCIGDELFQSVACHTSTPQYCLFRVNEETNRKQFYTIFLNWQYKVTAIDVFAVRACILNAEHLWYRGTEDVGIQQTHLVAQTRQCNGKVCRDGRLSYSTLSRRDGNNVLHLGKELAHLGAHCLTAHHADVTLNLHLLADIQMYGSLGRLDHRTDERVGWFVKDERETHLVAVDAYIVVNHSGLDKILSVPGVTHLLQCVHYKFWI